MAAAAACMSFSKPLNSSFACGEVAALHAGRQRHHLVAQLGLRVGEELALRPRRLWASRSCSLTCFQVGAISSFSRLEISVWSSCPPPPPPPPPPPLCCDCENSRSNGSAWMKRDVGAAPRRDRLSPWHRG